MTAPTVFAIRFGQSITTFVSHRCSFSQGGSHLAGGQFEPARSKARLQGTPLTQTPTMQYSCIKINLHSTKLEMSDWTHASNSNAELRCLFELRKTQGLILSSKAIKLSVAMVAEARCYRSSDISSEALLRLYDIGGSSLRSRKRSWRASLYSVRAKPFNFLPIWCCAAWKLGNDNGIRIAELLDQHRDQLSKCSGY